MLIHFKFIIYTHDVICQVNSTFKLSLKRHLLIKKEGKKKLIYLYSNSKSAMYVYKTQIRTV